MTWYLPEWDEKTTFLHAVASGDVAKVSDMLDASFSLETPNPSEGETPVLLAARLDKPAMVSYLIGRGADLHATNRFGQGLLHFMAAHAGTSDRLESVLSRGLDLEARNTWGATPVLAAAGAGCVAGVSKLLKAGADPFACDKDGCNLVFQLVQGTHSFPERPELRASYDAHLALLKDLVALGVDPRARGALGSDATTVAAGRGLTGVLSAFALLGVNLTRPDGRGLTPLLAAAFLDRKDTARSLQATTPNDFFALVAMDELERVRARLGSEPDLSTAILAVEGQPDCVLAIAAGHASAEMVRLLLNHGADPNGPSRRWSSILHAAISRGLGAGLIRTLIEKGAIIDRGDGDGNTALNLASRRGDIAVAEVLLDHGADVNSTTERGYTPLVFAKDEAMRAFLKGRGGRE
jgi:ankyrin repeat protein